MFPKKQNDGCNRYLHLQWRRRRAWTSTSWATRPASPPSSTSRETLISLHKVKFCTIFGGGPCPNFYVRGFLFTFGCHLNEVQSPALSSQPTLCRPRVQTLRHQDGPGVTRTNGALLPHSNPDTVNTNKDAEWFVWTMEQHHVDMWSLIVRRRLEKMWHCRWCIFPLIFSTAEKK